MNLQKANHRLRAEFFFGSHLTLPRLLVNDARRISCFRIANVQLHHNTYTLASLPVPARP